jgi:hypothetical protein
LRFSASSVDLRALSRSILLRLTSSNGTECSFDFNSAGFDGFVGEITPILDLPYCPSGGEKESLLSFNLEPEPASNLLWVVKGRFPLGCGVV